MPTKSKLTLTDEAVLKEYLASKSVQFGDLHERMKWLVGCYEELREYTENSSDDKLKLLLQNLGVSVLDLETEVSYTQPSRPPMGQRAPREAGKLAAQQGYVHTKNSRSP